LWIETVHTTQDVARKEENLTAREWWGQVYKPQSRG
jgi:hypothetical protein